MPRIVIIGPQANAIASNIAPSLHSDIEVICTEDRGVAFYSCSDDTLLLLADYVNAIHLTATNLLIPRVLDESEARKFENLPLPICMRSIKPIDCIVYIESEEQPACPCMGGVKIDLSNYQLWLADLLDQQLQWPELAKKAEQYKLMPPVIHKPVVSEARAEEVREVMAGERFDVLEFSPLELEIVIIELLKPYIYLLHWTLPQLENFVACIHSLYRNSPYHSWFHAVDVAQFLTRVLLLPDIQSLYSPVDMLTTILAGLVHDIDHDGVTNKGHSALSTERHRYSAKSTQERHHLAIAQQLFLRTKISHLIHNSLLHALIDATDLASHATHTKSFTSLAGHSRSHFIEHDEHRLLLLLIIMKAADLSNTVRHIDTSRKWGELLGSEFSLAYNRELSSEVPTEKQSFHSDPLQSHDFLQLGFFNNIIVPFYTVLSNSPMLADFMKPLVANAKSSAAHFEELSKSPVSNIIQDDGSDSSTQP